MISLFRKYLTSWFALGILGLVLVAFALSGVGNSSFSGLVSSGGVATVGGTEIGEAKLLAEFDRTLRRARQQTRSSTRGRRHGRVRSVKSTNS